MRSKRALNAKEVQELKDRVDSLEETLALLIGIVIDYVEKPRLDVKAKPATKPAAKPKRKTHRLNVTGVTALELLRVFNRTVPPMTAAAVAAQVESVKVATATATVSDLITSGYVQVVGKDVNKRGRTASLLRITDAGRAQLATDHLGSPIDTGGRGK